MADDAQWIDEAAEQQAAPAGDRPSPDTPVTADPGMMERLYQFINRNVFPPTMQQRPWQPGDKEPYFNKGPMARPPLVPPNYAPEMREGAIAQPVPMPQPDPRARPARRGVDQPAYSEDQWKDYFYQQLVDDMRRKGQRGPTQGGPR